MVRENGREAKAHIAPEAIGGGTARKRLQKLSDAIMNMIANMRSQLRRQGAE